MVFATSGQSNGASFLMAAGFLVAVVGYIAELVTITERLAAERPHGEAGR